MFKAIEAPTNPFIQQVLPVIAHASEILREEYQKYCQGDAFNIEHKSDTSPVTQADYRVNQYVIDELEKFSKLPVLSEEGKQDQRKNWQKFWLLDPLDGTKEFLHQRAEFTINLSIVEGWKTTIAILAIPCEYTVYIALETGLPLKFNSMSQQWFEFVEDVNIDDLIKIGLSQSSQNKPKYAEYLNKFLEFSEYNVFKAGSAYKFCMMLEDKIDIYPRFHPTCEWDTSAGQCLLERIGGGLEDFKGRPFSYNQRNTLLNNGFIAYRNNKMKNIAFKALIRMIKES